MRCLLNIWGVMLFLRLSWVIGQAGVGEGVAVICLANLVTLLTTISMSAVCTNGQIKGGGIYYMISRSLGPEFGGAIGLMFTLANSIAVSMYIVGFCESLQDLLRTFGITLIDGSTNDIRVVGIGTLVGILVLAMVGMDWVTRTQMVLLIVLIASQVDFVVGSIMGPKSDLEKAKGFVGYNMKTFSSNIWSDYREFEGVEHSFFSVFSVFFPAVTGIVAGANLSGDLKDPSSAIPIGTLLAILVTFLSYVGYAFMMGGCVLRDASGNVTEYLRAVAENPEEPWAIIANCTDRSCRFGLENDNQAMELVSSWGPLIYGGCFAATLSSAIASLVGAPRVLQALAKDKLYPFIGFFSKGHGANNDPVRGYMLVFLISLGCILIAQLNSIAPMLSNFFLAAYALINFSVFHASVSKSPGWRPAFKYYNAWVSLVGTLLCIAVMFLMSWWMALVTFFVVITLYLVELHVKNYRPQILALTGLPGDRPPLVDFANLITKGLSLLLCADIVKGNHSQRAHDALTRKAYHWFTKHRVKAFFTLTEGDFEPSARAFMQMCGLGKFRPNMLLMGYKSDWQTCDKEALRQYFNIIHYALDRYLAVGILRLQEGLDYSKLIQDEEFVPISSIDKKAEEEKIRRNQSTGQLAQVEVVSELPDSPCCSPLLEMDPEVITPEPLPESVVCGVKPSKSKKKNKNLPDMYLGPSGEPLSEVMWDQITRFRRKQDKGCIDVWWLYDDGGLTLLIPYILSTRSQFSGCKLRIFSLAHNKNELDKDQRNLAALLSKFRIDYSDVIVIPDIGKKATEETKKEFASLIENFRGDASDAGECRNKEQAQLLADVASKQSSSTPTSALANYTTEGAAHPPKRGGFCPLVPGMARTSDQGNATVPHSPRKPDFRTNFLFIIYSCDTMQGKSFSPLLVPCKLLGLSPCCADMYKQKVTITKSFVWSLHSTGVFILMVTWAYTVWSGKIRELYPDTESELFLAPYFMYYLTTTMQVTICFYLTITLAPKAIKSYLMRLHKIDDCVTAIKVSVHRNTFLSLFASTTVFFFYHATVCFFYEF
uniref:Uncharacterized protein n=1 Tax=Timema douglasi TaxID=61478 RepID=A0A7R8Z5H3_TIMDO|nr:unnamed protein product [Timema douglasi]